VSTLPILGPFLKQNEYSDDSQSIPSSSDQKQLI